MQERERIPQRPQRRSLVGPILWLTLIGGSGLAIGKEVVIDAPNRQRASGALPPPAATATLRPTEAGASPTPTPRAGATPELVGKGPVTITAEACPPTEGVRPETPILGEFIGVAVPLPANVLDIQVKELTNIRSTNGYIHPVYDKSQATKEANWRGIGPWNPVAFENLDANAAHLTTHANVGMLVVRSENGGRVALTLSQLQNHQHEGKWGRDASGQFVRNDTWRLQFTFHGLRSGQEVRVADPDTGRELHWPDGRGPIRLRANEFGTLSVEFPISCGDARAQFVFDMFGPPQGFQPEEVKVQRGPNDRPDLQGEILLPNSIVRTAIPEGR